MPRQKPRRKMTPHPLPSQATAKGASMFRKEVCVLARVSARCAHYHALPNRLPPHAVARTHSRVVLFTAQTIPRRIHLTARYTLRTPFRVRCQHAVVALAHPCDSRRVNVLYFLRRQLICTWRQSAFGSWPSAPTSRSGDIQGQVLRRESRCKTRTLHRCRYPVVGSVARS